MYYQHDARAMYQKTLASEHADAIRGRWLQALTITNIFVWMVVLIQL